MSESFYTQTLEIDPTGRRVVSIQMSVLSALLDLATAMPRGEKESIFAQAMGQLRAEDALIASEIRKEG